MNPTHSITRRNALKTMGAGAAISLTASNMRAIAQNGPNETINVGFIGVGGMGTSRLREFLRQDDVNVVGICDVDANHRESAREMAYERSGKKPRGFQDYRNLLEMPELDAVMIATPDHWHALTTIAACQAGVDVMVEKPLCHSINEGRAMVEAAKEHGRVTQMGNHIHSGSNYRRVVELVQSGNLGKISKVHCWHRPGMDGIAERANTKPPKELNYDMWLGPAPQRPYNRNRVHFNFRYFWDYSGGAFMDFWCHISDVAMWAMQPEHMLTVSATGGKMYWDGMAETPDTMEVIYAFPGYIMNWSLNPLKYAGYEEFGNIGCIFQGTEGTLVTNYGTNKVFVDGEEAPDFPRPEQTIEDSPGHVREFLNSVKSRKQPSCNVEYSHYLTKPGLLGNIAYRTGSTLQWDDEAEQVVANYRANELVNREYRDPWQLPTWPTS